MSATLGIGPALATLAGILEREKARGLETVALGEDGLARLRALPDRIREIRAAAGVTRREALPPSVGSPAKEPDPASLQPAGSSAPASPEPAPSPTDTISSATVPAATSDRLALPVVPDAERSEASRRQELNAIFRALKQAPGPRALGSLFETVVFATGNPSAEIVFVGEAPGAEEEKLRKPFVGPAGRKLDQVLKAMGLDRDQVYISNVVKFRPKMGDGRFQGARNRPPSQEEMASCLPFLRAEIEVVRPRVLVALGRTAAEGLLERGGAIAAFRGQVHDFGGLPVVVTYHPSYLLRQESASQEEGLRAKRQVWEDMLRVMALAGLPVTEKQRRYFT